MVPLLLRSHKGPWAVEAAAKNVRRAAHPLGRLRSIGLGAETESGLGLQASPEDHVKLALLLVPIERGAVAVPTLAPTACEPGKNQHSA